MNPAQANQRHNYKITDFFLDYDQAGEVPGEKKDILDPSQKEKDEGLFEGVHNKGKELIGSMLTQTGSGFSKVLEQWFGIMDVHHYFFLALLGVFTAVLCFFADLVSVYTIDSNRFLRIYCMHRLEIYLVVKNPQMNYNLRYLISIGIMIVSILIAVSMR
jgi:hypothetical protein